MVKKGLVSTMLTRELARFVEVKPASGTRKKALHATIVAAVTIAALSPFFGVPGALMGVSSIWVAVSAFDRSQRSRMRVLSRLAVTYTLVVAIGASASLLPVWLGVVVLAALGTVVAFGYHALLGDPPGPMLLIMGAATALYIPRQGLPIPQLVLITVLALVIACTTSLLLQLPNRRAAVQQQLEALRTAVAALEDAPDDLSAGERETLRMAAFAALFAAQASLVDSTSRRSTARSGREYLAIEEEIHDLHHRLVRMIVAEELPWAHVSERSFTDHYLGAPRERYMLSWAFSSASPAWLAARRTGVAILIAGEFSTILALSHPYWSMMTAALVLSTPADRISSAHRAGHRVVGTALGVALFLGLHSLNPSPILVAAIVVACLGATQMVAPRQYALASMLLTPMALLMTTMFAGRIDLGQLAGSRVIETVVGALAAMLVLWLPGRSTAIKLVRRQFRRTLRSADLALRQMRDNPGGATAIVARRNLHFEQLAAAKALKLALPDQTTTLEGWPDIEIVLGELTVTILAAARTADPARVLRWAAMSSLLEDHLVALPPVSSQPIDTGATAQALRDVLRIGRPGVTIAD